jgi:hypothetical protein
MTTKPAVVVILTLCLAACQGKGLTVIPQDPHSLDQFALGLTCEQQGRYLLAREHFELARATSRDSDMTRRCDAEIAAVDRAIKEMR